MTCPVYKSVSSPLHYSQLWGVPTLLYFHRAGFDAGPMAIIAAGHLSDTDDSSKVFHVLATAELPGGSSSSSGEVTPASNAVKVVNLRKGPAADRPFMGTNIHDSKESEDPGVRVELTSNYGMTVFAGSCVFVELHYERKLEDGSFEDVCHFCLIASWECLIECSSWCIACILLLVLAYHMFSLAVR